MVSALQDLIHFFFMSTNFEIESFNLKQKMNFFHVLFNTFPPGYLVATQSAKDHHPFIGQNKIFRKIS